MPISRCKYVVDVCLFVCLCVHVSVPVFLPQSHLQLFTYFQRLEEEEKQRVKEEEQVRAHFLKFLFIIYLYTFIILYIYYIFHTTSSMNFSKALNCTI